MPVLDNALEAGIMAFAPLLFAARFLPLTVVGAALGDPAGAARPGAVLGRASGSTPATSEAAPMAATVHGIFFGRVAPSTAQRRAIEAPALVVGHPADPIHPAADAAMLADEMPNATFVRARSILEWRAAPERLNALAAGFARSCWDSRRPPARRST